MGFYDQVSYVGSVQYTAVAQWAATHAYSVGNIVRQLAAPPLFNERCFICILAGTSLSSEPSWGVSFNRGVVVTEAGGPEWIDISGIPAFNGDKPNTNTWAALKTIFTGSVLCSAGNVCQDAAGLNYFVVTTSGSNLSSSEPTWNTTPGGTTADNSVTWTCVGPTTGFTNVWAAPHKLTVNALPGGTSTGQWLGAAGGRCFVADNHSETLTSGAGLNVGAGNQAIMSVDHTASVPPGSGSLRAGAAVSTNSGFTVGGNPPNASINANAYVYGLSITSTSASNILSFAQGGNTYPAYRWRFENCTFIQAAISGGAQNITLGPAIMAPYALNEFVNCTFSFAYAQQYLQCNGEVKMEGCTFSGTMSGSSGVGLFSVGTSNASSQTFECHARLVVEGSDLSGIASGGSLIYAGAKAGSIIFKDCKISSSLALITGGDAALTDQGLTIEFNRCDGGASAVRNERHYPEGTLVANTTVVRTTGASDGGTAISHQVIPTTKAGWVRRYFGIPLVIWNSVTGTNRNVTVYGIANDSRVPNNDEVWFDCEYLGSSTSPKGSYMRGTKANVLASGSALAADVSAWDSQAPARANSHSYSVGDVIKTASNPGRVFFCTGAGTSAASEPSGGITYTTWNPSDIQNVTLSGGNLVMTNTSSTNDVGRTTFGQTTGKFYFEVAWSGTASAYAACGIANSTASLASVYSPGTGAVQYQANLGTVYVNGSSVGTIAAWTVGHTICMAVDLVNQRAWFRVDGGNWNNNASYNPSTNTGGFDISSLFGGGIEARVYAAPSATATGTTATLNVGASSFAYTVPSGFSGLSTPTFNYSTAVDGTSGVDGTATFRAGCRFSQTLVLSSPQPQQAGYLYAYPKFARGSMTYWLDPLVQLS